MTDETKKETYEYVIQKGEEIEIETDAIMTDETKKETYDYDTNM